MDDAGEVTFKDVRFIEPEGEGKKQIFPYKSKVINESTISDWKDV